MDDMDLDDPYDPTIEDESWDDGAADVDIAVPKKKKGKLFTVVVIALGVVAFGAVLYVQGGKAPATAPAPEIPVSSADPALPPMPQVAVDQPDTNAAPLAPIPDLGEPPMPDPVAPTAAIPDLAPEPTEAIIEPPPPVAMTTDDPVVVPGADVPVTLSATPDPTITSSSVPETSVPDDSVPEPTAEEPELSVPVTPSMEQAVEPAPPVAKLQELEQRLDQLSKTPVGTATPADTTKIEGEIAALRQDLQALAARLEALEGTSQPVAQPAQENAPATPVVQTSTTQPEPADDVQPEPKPAPKPAPVATSTPDRPTYILRSVAGGRAYVAQTLTAPLKTLVVGDTLDGWGRVTDITKGRNGKWTVVTTGGTIRQK